MALRLDQGIPWSKDETTGFALAVIGSGLLATMLMAMIVPDMVSDPSSGLGRSVRNIPNPDREKIPLTFVFVAGALILLNYSPLKKCHAALQSLACVGLSACAGVADMSFRRDGLAIVPVHVAVGALWFLVFRVNWWFYWDNPSRRSIAQRVFASIVFTGIPILGLGLALWRLVCRIGVHEPTTTFAPADNPKSEFLETIIEDPALADHARRMRTIRSVKSGKLVPRHSLPDKDAVSGSI